MSSPVNSQGYPVGGIIMCPFNNLASLGRFLQCDGSLVSAIAFPELYLVIGNTFGGTPGSGNFNLPNLTNRFPLGVGSNALNASGGANNYLLGQNTMALHNHLLNDNGHTHQQANFHSHNFLACQSRSQFGASGISDWIANQETTGNTTGVGYANWSSNTTDISLQQSGGDIGGNTVAFSIQNPFVSLIYGIAY